MSIRDLLVQLATVKAIKDHIDKVLEPGLKAAIKTEVGGRMGATAAILPSGEEAATVWITKPGAGTPADPGGAPYVANPALFTEWVEQVDPGAIVKSVRSTDVPRLLALALATLEETGDLVPGVELTDPTPAQPGKGGGSVSVKQSEAQRDALVRAWQAGELVLPGMMPELDDEAAGQAGAA